MESTPTLSAIMIIPAGGSSYEEETRARTTYGRHDKANNISTAVQENCGGHTKLRV